MNRLRTLALAGLWLGVSICLVTPALSPAAHADSYRSVTRNYPWNSDHLTLDVPAHVHFHRAPSWHLTLRGPVHTLDRLVVKDGRIEAKRRGCLSLIPLCVGFGTRIRHAVDVSIAGPALSRVTVNSAGTVDLSGLHQDRLTVHINGSGTVRSSGTVQESVFDIAGSGSIVLNGLHQNRLTAMISGSGTVVGSGSTVDLRVSVSGSGKIRLAQLRDANARVSISGSADVDIAPTDSAAVRVDGSGAVHLRSHPHAVALHVLGSGKVTERSAGASGAPAH